MANQKFVNKAKKSEYHWWGSQISRAMFKSIDKKYILIANVSLFVGYFCMTVPWQEAQVHLFQET